MAILVAFEVKGSTAAKYDEVIRRLTEIGPENLQVINVFENQAKLDAFGATLMPILQDMGIEAKPTIFEIYNIIEGQ